MNDRPPSRGHGSLAEVVPSLLAGMGVPGSVDTVGLAGPRRVCLLLVDGLGWQLLSQHREDAPFLTALAAKRGPVAAGFPATTVTSLAALGTGTPAGQHGLVGYSFAARRAHGEELLNALRWQRHGSGKPADLRSKLTPEQLQPERTMFERAAEAGVGVELVVPHHHQDSGLSRAVLRGGRFHPVQALGDLVGRVLDSLRSSDRVLCYAYHADLDALGHVHGPGSDPWRRQLVFVDHLARMIAESLPAGSALVVTADHGMVEIGESDKVDFDTESNLGDGVRLLGGEARVRHVYVEDGAEADVRDRWTARLGTRAWIASRDEAIAEGWFGPKVLDRVRPRIGDLVVAGRDNLAVVRSRVEPRLSSYRGHHGSHTDMEQLIPLLVHANTD
ncbi:alkaline phosphatase family protein [Actinokineospora sp. G85]|uniref:alkaline phosphatase family protein n=1 Tax=Actinokineospora sp. G85 TaxID=3406626 RepID=UPI003C73885A